MQSMQSGDLLIHTEWRRVMQGEPVASAENPLFYIKKAGDSAVNGVARLKCL